MSSIIFAGCKEKITGSYLDNGNHQPNSEKVVMKVIMNLGID